MPYCLFFMMLFSFCTFIYDSAFSAEKNKTEEYIFFDADSALFQNSDQHYHLQGQVVAISPKMMLTADDLVIDKLQQQILAKGHVFFLNKETVIYGEELSYNWISKNMIITQGWVISDDPKRSKELWQTILGFTPESKMESSSSEEKAQQFEARRQFLAENPPPVKPDKKIFDQYFRLTGDRIEQITQGTFEADRSFITGCKCEDDELAPWGFQAASVEAEEDGYADLKHAWLKVKGVPVFYLPYVRIPIKSRRQSGFLIPGFSFNSRQGARLSLPFFGAISQDQDITLESTYLQKQKWQLGLEYRIKTTQVSGLEIEGSQTAEKRGKLQWNGNHFFHPRVSLVSEGLLLSDPRYVQDYEGSSYNDQTGFFEQRTRLTTESGVQMHVDLSDFYLGLIYRQGQYLRETKPRKTIQEPIVLRCQSRLFSLFPKGWMPLYASFDYQGKKLDVPNHDTWDETPNTKVYRLGSGSWHQSRLQLILPILQNTAVDMNAFSDWRWRHIDTAWIPRTQGVEVADRKAPTNLYSMRTGVQWNLPMSGQMDLTETSFLEHNMEWSLILTTQPIVKKKDGEYGDFTERWIKDKPTFVPLTFYETDSHSQDYSDFMDDKEAQTIYQRVTFLTNHSWLLGVQSTGSKTSFLTLKSSLSYDHEKQKKRWKSTKNYYEAPKAWTTIDTVATVTLLGNSLTSDSHYDLYVKKNTYWSFNFSSRPFLGNVSGTLLYLLQEIPKYDNAINSLNFLSQRQKEATLRGHFFASLFWTLAYGIKDQKMIGDLPKNPQHFKMSRANLMYNSPTQCWGLGFEWSKPYEKPSWKDGYFLLNLSIESFGMKQKHNLYDSRTDAQ